jgi:hypothetical protein
MRVFLLAAALACLPPSPALATEETDAQKLVIAVERIWDRAAHSAFTDLAVFNGRYYCAFREGDGHVPGLNGLIRVIESEDAENWRSVALLDEPEVDLRDPKLSVTPDQRLCVNMGGSFYHGKTRLKMESRVSFSDGDGRNFSAPLPIPAPDSVRTDMDWLWRVTWHEGAAWAAIQQVPEGRPRALQLVRSTDATRWEAVHTMEVPHPSETTLRFLDDGRMLALIRRSGPAPSFGWLGVSKPPFTEWEYRELDLPLGGPNMVRLPGGRWLAATRGQGRKMLLALLDVETAGVTPLIELPSDGDCSYAGLVVEPDKKRVLVSYYSTHEEKTSIYLATLRLDAIEAWSAPAR